MVVARGSGAKEYGELLFNEYRLSDLQDKKNSGVGWWGWLYNSMNVFNITELYKMVMMVLFMLRMFYYNKKFEKKC